jgi:hypothetical protein
MTLKLWTLHFLLYSYSMYFFLLQQFPHMLMFLTVSDVDLLDLGLFLRGLQDVVDRAGLLHQLLKLVFVVLQS